MKVNLYANIGFRPWAMQRAPVDEEAPKDPGALNVHQSFSEQDFEGKFS